MRSLPRSEVGLWSTFTSTTMACRPPEAGRSVRSGKVFITIATKKAIPQFSELPMHVLSGSVKFFDVLEFEVADQLLDNALMMPPGTWPGD